MCRGSGEGDSGSVVSCSHPEPSATILGKTRISRPQRKPGGLAGRAEYPSRQRAPPGRARAPGRDAETWGGAGVRAGGRSVVPRPLLPAPPPSCLPSSPAQGLLGRGSCSRLPGVLAGLVAILGSGRGSVFLLSHDCLWPHRKKRVHAGSPLEPPGVLETPWYTQVEELSRT